MCRVGRKRNGERLRGRLDLQRHDANFVIGHGLCRVGAFDQHDRDVHVGRVIGTQRQAIKLAVARHLNHFVLEDAAALDRDQRDVRPLVRRGDEDFGSLAGLIRDLVRDEVDAVVVLPLPRNMIFARHPDKERRAWRVERGASICLSGDDAIGTTLRWDEGKRCFALVVGRDSLRVNEDVVRLGLPRSAAGFVLDERVLPLAAIDFDLEILVRQARMVAAPIHRDEVDRERLARLADVFFRRQADIIVAAMRDDFAPTRDDLIVAAGRRGFDNQAQAAGDGSREFRFVNRDGELTLGIGRAAARENDLALRLAAIPPTIKAHPWIVHIAKAVRAAPFRLEIVILVEHIPSHRHIGDVAAKEILDLHRGARVHRARDLGLIRRDDGLELGRAIGGHLERGLE